MRRRAPLLRAAAAPLLMLLLLAAAAANPAADADSAPAPLPSSPSSPELTADSFAPYLRALDPRQRVVFLAYASWCGHCRAYMPHWNKAARWLELKTGGGGKGGGGKSGSGSEKQPLRPLLLVKLDCAAHGDVCDAFSVRSYPTVLAGTAAQVLGAYERAQEEQKQQQEAAKSGAEDGDGEKEKKADGNADKDKEEAASNPSLAALRRFPGGGPKGDGAAASLAYRHDAKGTVAWVGRAAFFEEQQGGEAGGGGDKGGGGSKESKLPPPLPGADSPVWSFDEEALAAAEAGEAGQGEGGGGGSSDKAATAAATTTPAPPSSREGWSLADAEAATLELWDQALSAMAAAAKGKGGRKGEAGAGGGATDNADDADPWAAARAVLALWRRAHPSARCRQGSRAAMEALWPDDAGGGSENDNHNKPPLRAAASPSLQVCGPEAEAAWARSGRGARGGGDLPWERCRGSVKGARGYTCGLWVVWHSCAARLVAEGAGAGAEGAGAGAETEEGAAAATKLLSEALRRFAAALFRCRECAAHFSRMLREGVPAEGLPPLAKAVVAAAAEESGGGGKSSSSSTANKAAALWLWRAHDAANRRLARDEARRRAEGWTASGDPSAPKRAWPPARLCPACVAVGGGGGAGGERGEAAARWLNHRHDPSSSSSSSSSSYWDLDAVAAFLQGYYGGAGEGGGLGGGGGGDGGGDNGGNKSNGGDKSNGSSSSLVWLAPPLVLLTLALATRRGRARVRGLLLLGGGGGLGGSARPGSSGAFAARRGASAAGRHGGGGAANGSSGNGLLHARGNGAVAW